MGDSGVGANDAVRVLLELAALAAFALAGLTAADGPVGLVLAAALPLAVAVVWGTFRVPDDPGPAPVAVSGRVRLCIEGVLFAGAAASFFVAGRPLVGGCFAALVVGHYALAHRRVRRLLA